MTLADTSGVLLVVDKLYVVGGSDSQMSLVSVEVFDFISRTWTPGPALGTPRANMGVSVVHQRLFAVGGFSGKSFLDSVEYLSAGGEQWCSFWPADSAGILRADRSLSLDNAEVSDTSGSLLSETGNKDDSILNCVVASPLPITVCSELVE